MQKHIKPWWHEDIKRNYPQILDKRHENKTWNPVSTIGGLPFFSWAAKYQSRLLVCWWEHWGKAQVHSHLIILATSVCVFKCLYICVCVFLQVPQQGERSVEDSLKSQSLSSETEMLLSLGSCFMPETEAWEDALQ